MIDLYCNLVLFSEIYWLKSVYFKLKHMIYSDDHDPKKWTHGILPNLFDRRGLGRRVSPKSKTVHEIKKINERKMQAPIAMHEISLLFDKMSKLN